MELPKDLILPILEGKVKTIFKLFSGRHELCGERNLTKSRRTYAIADIDSTRTCHLDEVSDLEIKRGNFPDRYAFEKWWFSVGYREENIVHVINFDILRYTPRGKWFLKKMGKRIPKIRDD